MQLVYLVYHHEDNDCDYEDYFRGERVVAVFMDKGKAKEWINSQPIEDGDIEGYANDEWKEDIESIRGFEVIRAFHFISKYGATPHEWYSIREMMAEE